MLKYPVHFSHWQIFQSPQKEKIGSNCNQQSWETIFLVNKIVMKYVFNEPFSKHNTKADINMHSSRQKVFLAGGFFFYQSSLAHKSKFGLNNSIKYDELPKTIHISHQYSTQNILFTLYKSLLIDIDVLYVFSCFKSCILTLSVSSSRDGGSS